MGKGRPRAVEKGVLGQSSSVSSSVSSSIPPGPVYYPSEDEFKDPLEYLYKIRPEAEPYGICRIVPPKSWKPPFGLDLDTFTFPTKTQAIHQLQARPAACDSKTFDLEYNRFLEDHCGKKSKKRVVFEGEELDLCKLFNAAKRFGGYDKVVKEKKWGEVFRFVRSGKKISECAKHVLCQLYSEHLYDYEEYYNQLNREGVRSGKRGMHGEKKVEHGVEFLSSKRRRRNIDSGKVKVCKVEQGEEQFDQICEQCGSGLHGEVMLLCDRCNKGWHIYCLSPPLKRIPPGNWYCLECLNSNEDSFGFVPGRHFSLEAFRREADRVKRKWFGSLPPSRMQIEKKFWEIVEGLVGEVEVMYGSDLDTSVYGSGFPHLKDKKPESVEGEIWDKYCASPWNLNNLPKLKGSMLRAIHHNIAGVMVPWLYIGMLFSSFCWHFEDHCFYSMNYLHWGEPKCWYSVPGSQATSFEKVMRNCLPDLFDAQPDLLFQLVTMLNPSVLQGNGVSVYSAIQEPGNFVITFPRSYHGGFNFGLNCAEAVNFAPADWLPHGGFGAELYQLYRKAAVLSHEELLCVVAKANDYDSRAIPYLKKELHRIYAKEKNCRGGLWRNGIIKSSPMSPKKCPDFVGTEEDPTCIICQQYLFLSAVVCCCRPSAFVCIEHWEHLCECKPSKHRLLYRHTLAELKQLVLSMDKYNFEETLHCRELQRQLLGSDDSSVLTKKVKGGHVSLAILAEEWLLRSSKILQIPFSRDAYVNALKETEQFLWAGSEMDAVRLMAKNLIEAQTWAEGIKDCLCKIEFWSCNRSPNLERVDLEHINNLLNLNPLPCVEPGHLKLKGYAEEAMILVQEVDYALSTSSKSSVLQIPELEQLYSRVGEVPIHLKEMEKLGARISALKVWVANVRKCILEKCPAAIEVDVLYRLKSQMLELQIQLPEVGMLMNLLQQVESCQVRCNEILNGPINLKDAEVLLQEFDSINVNMPEIKLLRQYHADAVSWISHFRHVCVNVHEREDQENVIYELKCILQQGMLLKIQVDEFRLVDIELKKAYCRREALKTRCTKMTLCSIQQLMEEAVMLQIVGEQLFVDVSGVLAAAMQWEKRAAHIFASEAEMSNFEDIIRASEDIRVILPSLDSIKDAVSMAKSWLKESGPFLGSSFPAAHASHSLLKVQALKELVSQSELLKIYLEERTKIHSVLRNCTEWVHDAYSLLEDADSLFNMNNLSNASINGLIPKIGSLITKIESILGTGLSLGFDFVEIPKLQSACSTLQWCNEALSFCTATPTLQRVKILMEHAEHLPITSISSALCISLIDGVKWLKKALEVIPVASNHKRCKLSDAEEVLSEVQRIEASFPLMVDQLLNAIEKHRLWKEQTHNFFGLKTKEGSWSKLLQLEELGKDAAFSCCEFDRVLSETEKIKKWKQHCMDIVGDPVGEVNSLLDALVKIKGTLDRSLYIYKKSGGCNSRDQCIHCFTDLKDQELLTCSICKDCYHLQCLGASLGRQSDAEAYVCSYCQFIRSGLISRNSVALRFGGKCLEVNMLTELLSDAEGLCVGIEEVDVVQQLVELAIACKDCLLELTDFTLAYIERDLNITSEKLTTALKAVEKAGVYCIHGNNRIELALARNSWRVRVNKLLEDSQKPLIKHIQGLMKEGMAIGIPTEDHFKRKLTELKCIGLQWAEIAKKVAMDSGALGLDEVYKLIAQGENLPVHFEKELKLLRARSMLYCICRKPYDGRAMVACDRCDEWYHFECIKLSSAPKVYICPACDPHTGELANKEKSSTGADARHGGGEPQTPSPPHLESRRKNREGGEGRLKQQIMPAADMEDDQKRNVLRPSGGSGCLLWRNRKPFRRLAKRRAEVESLSPFFRLRQTMIDFHPPNP